MSTRCCRIRLLSSLLVACTLAASARPALAGEASAIPEIAGATLLDHVKRLASDDWEGRGSGTAGEAKATDYVAGVLRSLGYEPAGDGGSYFQRVTMAGATKLGPDCRLELADQPPGFDEFEVDRDYRPFVGSASAKVEGELVFAGYGIHAPGSYDDYAGLDVRGRVVLIFRHMPHGKGLWEQGAARTTHAPFRAKLQQAQQRGAAALLIVNDPYGFPTRAEAEARGIKGRPRPDALVRGMVGLGRAKIPVLHLTRNAAARLIALTFATTIEQLEDSIHQADSPAPASRSGGGHLRLQSDLQTQQIQGRNVCGLLRAGGPDATDEIVVVGAHHDHLGRGMRGSLARNREERRQIHNGADDNASGTAGLLEVARHLASARDRLNRSVLVMTFTGEERGLLGSRHFCENPTVDFAKVVAMLNMDMIGRLEGRQLFVGGVKTAPAFRPILERRIEQVGIKATFGDGGRAPSDNTSFYNKNKPVLFFFSGMHPDYHRPSDDWAKIDAAGMESIARLVGGVAEDVARLPEAPIFQKADSGGFGPPRAVLGISVGIHEKGVLVSGLSEGGAAAKAGLIAGDVLVAVAGKPTPDVLALRRVMRRLRIGDAVKVEFLRDGVRQSVEVKLGRG